MNDRYLRKQVEALKRQKIARDKVVNLAEFRSLMAPNEAQSVLVVDDDEVMRNALKRILEAEGYRVSLACDGLELSRVLEGSRLDLILLDVNLPWVDGLEMCRLIKGHQALSMVPVIMVSARKGQEDISAGIDAGADDYITKPFDIDKMIELIGSHLKEKKVRS
jgi:DNA-binding response OmpR family regulator